MLRSDDVTGRRRACDVMVCVLDAGLRLLHPLMPHLTEELAGRLAGHSLEAGPLLQREYPDPEQVGVWCTVN